MLKIDFKSYWYSSLTFTQFKQNTKYIMSTASGPSTTSVQNSAQIMDFVMNNIIIQRFGDVMKGNFEMTFKSIVGLIFLLSITEIKGFATSVLSDIKPFLKNLPMLFYFLLTKLKNAVRGISFRKPLLIKDAVQSENFIDIDTNDAFLNALYLYIQKYNNDNLSELGYHCKFIESCEKIVLSNIKEGHVIKNISCISFMKNIAGQLSEITIMNPIIYNISIKTDEPLSDTKIGALNTDPKKISSLLDMFTEEQRKVIEYVDQEIIKNKGSSTHDHWFAIMSEGRPEHILASAIIKNYPSFNLDDTIKNIGIVCYIMRCMGIDPLTKTKEILQSKKLIFDIFHSYEIVIPKGAFSFYDGNLSGQSYTGKTCEQLNEIFKDFITVKPNKSDATSSYTLHIKYTNNIKPNINDHVKKLIAEIYTHQNFSSEGIKIYYLVQEKNIEYEEKSNPAYTVWYEKKKMMDELDVNNPESKANLEHKASLINEMPSKTITIEKYINKINVKMLNDSSKDINTLYLRKEDKDKLINSLDQFKYEKKTLKELGLPNKLNVLLHGLPGTGKSTAILAIATYLNRDIYYIDLKNATTNDDLRMMFEHVNKHVQNGGIIVIEDIDAMTSVVLDRKNKDTTELNVNGIMASSTDSLSLEYLLNILQGTLTMDDSIFIVTTNYINHLDPAFYRDGRFDVNIELKLCDHYQVDQIYEKYIKRKIRSDILKSIPEDKFSPANIIFHVKDYIFNKAVPDEKILAKFIQQDNVIVNAS